MFNQHMPFAEDLESDDTMKRDYISVVAGELFSYVRDMLRTAPLVTMLYWLVFMAEGTRNQFFKREYIF